MRARHLVVGVLMAGGVLAAASATASNMAFKISITLHRAPNCSVCDTWISLPFDNRFRNQYMRSLCDSNGDGVVTTADQIAFVTLQGRGVSFAHLDPAALDATVTHSCTGPFIPEMPIYVPTRAVRLRPKTGPGDLQVIYVGTDIPGTRINYRKSRFAAPPGSGDCFTCDNWVDLVYHTTYRDLRDACDSNRDGLVTPADEIAFVTQQRSLASITTVDSTTTISCAGPGVPIIIPIIIGRGLRVRLKPTAAGDVLMTQPHF